MSRPNRHLSKGWTERGDTIWNSNRRKESTQTLSAISLHPPLHIPLPWSDYHLLNQRRITFTSLIYSQPYQPLTLSCFITINRFMQGHTPGVSIVATVQTVQSAIQTVIAVFDLPFPCSLNGTVRHPPSSGDAGLCWSLRVLADESDNDNGLIAYSNTHCHTLWPPNRGQWNLLIGSRASVWHSNWAETVSFSYCHVQMGWPNRKFTFVSPTPNVKQYLGPENAVLVLLLPWDWVYWVGLMLNGFDTQFHPEWFKQ